MAGPIGVVLNLPRCGGTLFGRILQGHSQTTVLSETHPAYSQAHLGEKLRSAGLSFALDPTESWAQAIRRLSAEISNQLIVRDHTHADFTAQKKCSFSLRTVKALQAVAEIRVMALFRHPVDEYLSCLTRVGMRGYLTPQHFATGYIGYALATKKYPRIRYEDVIAQPQQTVRQACDLLGLSYDPQMLERFHSIHTISGDRDQPSRAYKAQGLVALPRQEGWDHCATILAAQPGLQAVAEDLGYGFESLEPGP